MRRNNLFKTIIILLSVAWSAVVLYPTFELSQLKDKAQAYYSRISESTSLSPDDINEGLRTNDLELRVRDSFKGSNGRTIDELVTDVSSLASLHELMSNNEAKAIKLGLDLQGGTYLVYEVDLAHLLLGLAKETNDDLKAALEHVHKTAAEQDVAFFDLLQTYFNEKGLPLKRFFGRRTDSDSDVISGLEDEAEDAVNRTLEVLRNRIDQFGVSEPSITKQGAHRIVVELPGVKDVNRAKALIGTTALLEFQMESDPEVIMGVRNGINNVMKRQLSEGKDLGEETAGSDSGQAKAKIRQETEVHSDDIFGQSSIVMDDADGDSAKGIDSTLLVDEEVFQDRPFDALLGDVGGDIVVPTKNLRTVERIINSKEVQDIIRPTGGEFLFFNRPTQYGDQEYYRLFMVKKEPELTGKMIANASVQIGSQLQAGRSVVSMELTSEGAKIFSRVTGANVGKRLAIVLDGKIVSIPNIQERIPSGRAQITGMANIDEAKDLAIVLRAGALDAPIEVIEERTVGPSLGQDSIDAGTSSAWIGFVLVVVFMIAYYRMSGLVADIALFMNLFIIMAVLAGFGATLTLPGVAGIILTIGMAVDANVLIFERIREELRQGKTIRSAIDSGYQRAFTTILDANVTTLLTALVLYQFGSGPIRGFALTLAIGILVSMFTAIVVTRVIFDYFTNRVTVKKLSI